MDFSKFSPRELLEEQLSNASDLDARCDILAEWMSFFGASPVNIDCGRTFIDSLVTAGIPFERVIRVLSRKSGIGPWIDFLCKESPDRQLAIVASNTEFATETVEHLAELHGWDGRTLVQRASDLGLSEVEVIKALPEKFRKVSDVAAGLHHLGLEEAAVTLFKSDFAYGEVSDGLLRLTIGHPVGHTLTPGQAAYLTAALFGRVDHCAFSRFIRPFDIALVAYRREGLESALQVPSNTAFVEACIRHYIASTPIHMCYLEMRGSYKEVALIQSLWHTNPCVWTAKALFSELRATGFAEAIATFRDAGIPRGMTKKCTTSPKVNKIYGERKLDESWLTSRGADASLPVGLRPVHMLAKAGRVEAWHVPKVGWRYKATHVRAIRTFDTNARMEGIPPIGLVDDHKTRALPIHNKAKLDDLLGRDSDPNS